MRLPFFRVKDPADAGATKPRRGPAPKTSDEGLVQAARVRARRRLVGALVLLAAGVVGFPVLFETQPRPLPVNTPILVADAPAGRVPNVSPPSPRPALPADAGAENAPVAAAPAAASAPVNGPASAPISAPASPPVNPPPAAKAAAAQPAPAASPTVASRTEPAKSPARPSAEPKPAPVATAADATPAAPAAAAGRFVVQVGAYNEPERLKAARQKVEKLGYKSYTQDVESNTGKRTRVRLGPFATRQEADAVAGKVKGAGMQANVLAL